ncbi:hypothetical protein [Nostoc punctiforme]|uniref:Uncharacterized protein n=1 Tax=Nostoc punctiforme NIES-2108 TaxID=1356359 RepID=A0A367QZS4_NOSPU|nr:hypothetical protein [Nostoc punctiforme]RCJ29191.1 hypothetical protein A6769_35950 [Nostoc punctiforme NIES-2108]
MNFDLKNISKKQWVALGAAIALLVMFMGCEYLKRQPADDAARQLEGVLKKDKEIEQQYKR